MKKKFVRFSSLIMVSLLLLTTGACSQKENEVETQNQSTIESKYSKTEEKLSSSNIPNESSEISADTQSSLNNDSSDIQSEVSDRTVKLIDDTKYPRPDVSDNKIIRDLPIDYSNLEQGRCIVESPELLQFIMKNFDGKIYEAGQIIDVKKELTSLGIKDKEKYYSVYSLIYSMWYSSSITRYFEKIEGVQEDYIFFKIDKSNNLKLKYKKIDGVLKVKLNIYFKNQFMYLLVTEI